MSMFEEFDEPVELPRTLCSIPNPTSYAILEKALKDHLGARMQLLTEAPEYEIVKKATRVADVPREMRRYVPQDHPLWLEFRSEAQVTGSVLAELMGFHDVDVAKALGDVPPVMHTKEGTFNRAWDDYLDKQRFPGLPSMPLDPPGNFYASGGTHKEFGAAGTLVHHVKGMIYREVGAIEIMPRQLAAFNIVDRVSKERITELPFRMVISPDMDATIPAALDGDGNPAGPMIDVAGEIKAPTFFGQKDSSRFRGLEYYAKGRGCQPYKEWKTYYALQPCVEALALMRHKALMFAYTLSQGATAWIIDVDDSYLSLIFTALLYIFRTYVADGKRVPTNVFSHLPRDDPYRRAHDELVERSRALCRTAAVYLRITPEQTKKFGDAMGYMSTKTFYDFPELPEGVIPPHQLVCIFMHRLVRNERAYTWTTAWAQIDVRRRNLAAAARTAMTAFVGAAAEVVEQKQLHAYEPAAREHVRVQSRATEAAEKLVVRVLRLIHELYGEPPFGQHLDLSLFYMNLIYRASGGTDDLPPHDFAIADHLGVFGDDWFNAIVAAHTRSVPWTDAAVTFLENTREPDSAGPTTWHAQRVVCGLAIREELAPRVRPPK